MYHTAAFILRKDVRGEADCLVTAFTERFGKIRLIAQGARKHGAKLQGHIEPGVVGDISFVTGKNGYRLTTARMREYFPEIRESSMKTIALAMTLRALDENFFEDGNDANALFKSMNTFFGALALVRDVSTTQRLLLWFTVRLLGSLGLIPDPESYEARAASYLLELGQRPVDTVLASTVSTEHLIKELQELIMHFDRSVRLPEPRRLVSAAVY